jgi:catechol 2,3-dioxygenase-like lactoylglutathione lyase family enzyme
MKIQNINHVTINTTDIEASTRFYGQTLGFRQLETVPFDGFSLVYFEIPGGGRMELFDYGGRNPRTTREESEAGLRHLAFTVDDVDGAEAFLRSNGVKVTMAATDLPSLNSRAILFLDPNGVTLEFCQKMAKSGPA